MLGIYLDKVRSVRPIIHSITNYVTAGDCANMLIACGASPIMADEPEEVSEITSRCSGLNINMGTLNTARIESMVIAGKRSNEL
ncbi:MAG: hydroxyethylthiazole kinase, partial [Firmicutes bacterium]|nr:hydroxyethylthiazole kinase [Bacillota bacterium]